MSTQRANTTGHHTDWATWCRDQADQLEPTIAAARRHLAHLTGTVDRPDQLAVAEATTHLDQMVRDQQLWRRLARDPDLTRPGDTTTTTTARAVPHADDQPLFAQGATE